MKVFHNLNVRRCAFRCMVLHCSLQHGVEQSMIVYLNFDSCEKPSMIRRESHSQAEDARELVLDHHQVQSN